MLRQKLKRFGYAVGLVGLLLIVLSPLAAAQSVTQGYEAAESLQDGMIVQLKPTDEGKKVVALTQENELVMLGVVVASTDSPVSISDPTKQQVFVASTGQYAVLVSTQNGPIKAGDYITISTVKGVGMKSDGRHQVVLGKALQNFAESSNAESHVKLSAPGYSQTVALGRILVDVGVARNPAYNGDNVAGVPSILTKAARLVTNKPITALRLYMCMATLFVALSVSGGILFAGARSGMLAVGRNPLAKNSIFRSMISVILMALVVVILGVVAVYLLLKV